LPQVTDKRKTAIEIRRALASLPVSKDILVTTPEEIACRGDLVGSVLRPALREGKVLYRQASALGLDSVCSDLVSHGFDVEEATLPTAKN
jgi:hypothetical protein